MFDLEIVAGVEGVVEVALFLQALGLSLRGEDGEPLRVVAYIVEAIRTDGLGVAKGGGDEIFGEDVLHELQGLTEEEFFFYASVLFFDLGIATVEDADVLPNVTDLKQTGLDAVVEIGGEIGDLVRKIDDLGFERRTLAEVVECKFGVLVDGVVAGVLDDALADAEGEIQAAVGGVALLEVLDDTQGVKVVVEAAAVALETLVEGALACMAERRVADVMNEGQGLGKIFVEAEGVGAGAGDLRDLDGVSETAAEVIGRPAGEDLRLTRETAEGARLHDTLAVALERSSKLADRRRVYTSQKRIVHGTGHRASMQVDWHIQIRV